MDFRILGPLEVVEGERAIGLPGAKHRTLLAMLLVHANEVVSTEGLIEALWEDDRPQGAHKTLQVYVSQLRKALGDDRVRTRAPGYVLRVEAGELDVARFERLADAGRLTEALALWRGPPLAEFHYQRFAQGEIARLEELRLACLERRIEDDLDAGRHGERVGELRALVRAHPLRERLAAQLMLALYRSGRQAEALAAYREARRVLVGELGLEPGRSLRELEQAILEQDPRLELVAASRPAARAPGSAFVGREAELGDLRAGLEAALAGHGRLFLVGGEPGAGKSRLAEELTREAAARGASILTGRCWEGGGAPVYWPWVQSLRGYVRETPPELLRAQLGTGAVELAQILPELRGLLPGLPGPVALGADEPPFRLLCATAEFLRNACGARPAVLVLDDLHAADPPSLVLLTFLARELRSIPLLVLGAYRDVDPVPGDPLHRMIVEALREPATRRLALGGLSRREVARYVESAAPALASPELAAALHDQTEGNPLFVVETVRLLALEGAGPGPPGGPRLTIPRNVRDVIARRLGHLSEACKRVLVLAAVLGREFAVDALARLADLAVDELLDHLDEAIAARVVADVPGAAGRLRFAHVLIRDTLYDELPAARRVRLHRLAAEALEALYGASLEGQQETPERVLALAQHWFEAGVPARAIDCYRRGGELALRVFANYQAAEALTRGVDLLRRLPESRERDEQELALTVLLGAARGWGSPDYARARDLCAKLGRAVSPPILRGLAMNSILGQEFGDAKEDGLALLAAGQRDADPVLVVEGEYVLGVTLFWEGRFRDAARHLEAAIGAYAPEHRPTHLTLYSQDPQVVCLSRLAWTRWFLGQHDGAAAARDAALALADDVDHPFSCCYATLYGAIVSDALDDEPGRARLLAAAERLAADERFELLGAWTGALRNAVAARQGDRAALHAARTAIDRLERTHRALLNGYLRWQLARACLAANEPELGLEAVTTALADAQRTGGRYMDAELRGLRARLATSVRR